jgi:hypothetical protein
VLWALNGWKFKYRSICTKEDQSYKPYVWELLRCEGQRSKSSIKNLILFKKSDPSLQDLDAMVEPRFAEVNIALPLRVNGQCADREVGTVGVQLADLQRLNLQKKIKRFIQEQMEKEL